MHYAPQILLCCTAWICLFAACVAKEPIDPELLKKVTKDVESVLSPTLVDELQGAHSNRSAVNVEQTVPRDPEPPKNIHDKKPEIHFDNQVHPYHYERSYHYEYPPKPGSDPSKPIGYYENFYEPRFRPKSHVADSHDPSYYRSELYNPFGSNAQATSNANDNGNGNGDVKQTDNPERSEVFNGPTPLPPSSFPHPAPFPSVDLDGYRHGVFGRPLGNGNYFRNGGGVGQQKDQPPHYLPQRDGRFPEPLHQRPVETFQPLPPLDSFQNYPGKEFQGYNEPRASLPENSAHRPPPPFLGSFFPPGYQSPFYNSYRPSEHFNSLFSDNFTRNFPLRPSFGGFYPSHNYLPPPPSPSPLPNPAPESKPEDPVPPGGPSSQPIPTTKPDDPAPTAAASNAHYELKLFFPARDDNSNRKSQPRSSSGELTYIAENFRF